MKCQNITYQVNKIYSIDKMKICESGFHFCQKAEDTLKYYNINDKDFILLEVEALGKLETETDKSVTDKIKIIRIIPKEEYKNLGINVEYDSNNNLIYSKHSSGDEFWYEYDSNNNLIHNKNYNGYEIWQEFDSNNNLIYHKDSSAYEEWNKYDSNNNRTYYKDSDCFEYCKEYDSNNNLIYYKNSVGKEFFITIE
jgi:YD repeat-containing protein